MSKSIFYSSIRSPHCLKIGMVLTEKQIPFQRVEIDLRAKQQKTDAFLAINPAGQVPVYVDEHGIHADSLIIMQHVDQLVPDPPLFPADPQARQIILDWIELSSTRARDVSHELYWQLLEPPADGTDWDVVDKLKAEGRAILAKLDNALADGPYVCGDLSAADFGLLPWIYGYGRFDLLESESFSNVQAWLDRMTARPSFRANFQVEGRAFEEK